MARFASGKNAYGISDRSGFRYRLNDMRKEWTGMLVGKDEWEQKHPQLLPRRDVTDAQALKDPRPDRIEPMAVYVGVPTVEQPSAKAVRGIAKVGAVGVSTS